MAGNSTLDGVKTTLGLGDLPTMSINHLLKGMILQVSSTSAFLAEGHSLRKMFDLDSVVQRSKYMILWDWPDEMLPISCKNFKGGVITSYYGRTCKL